MLRRVAGRVADTELPTAVRAVFGYYAHAGVFDPGSLGLKRRTDAAVAEMIDDAFGEIERALAEEFGYDYVTFEYDTKLVLPAKLTLGYLYRDVDGRREREAEAFTQLAVEALLDGDMRDAINDEEYGDFTVDFGTDRDDRARVAAIAQEILQSRVEEGFGRYDPEVREIYDWAVEVSERHQEEDEQFRDLMARARNGETEALEGIRNRYKYGEFESTPSLFTEEELELPYLKSQYERVGVIYDAMIEMYREAGFEIGSAFQRSIVLAIIGAQIWLDDLDDYEADLADGQLTPVTAEYLLADSATEARESVITISESYLDRAREQATEADSALTGIATEYIHRDGEPGKLPATRPPELS